MKSNETTNHGIAAAAMFVLVCAFSGLATAYDESQRQEAERYYQEGVTSYAVVNYRQAISSFKKSYDLVPYAETAYYLSVVHSKLGIFREAEYFAQKALTASPPLQNELVTDAKRIIAWATRVKEVKEAMKKIPMEKRAKADIVLPPPPEVRIPRSPPTKHSPSVQ